MLFILISILGVLFILYVGYKAVQGATSQKDSFQNVLVLPLSTFIPCKWDLMEDDFLKDFQNTEKQALKKLIQDLFTCFDHRYHHFLIEMNVNYHLLNPQRESKDVKNLDEIELHFLTYLRSLFYKGDFHPLADVEYNFGTAESFQLTFPIEVDYEQLNPEPFKKFVEKTGHNEQLSEYIWIFCRGNGETKMTDRFFWTKVDLCIFAMAHWISSWFRKAEAPKCQETPKEGILLKRQRLEAPSSILEFFKETTVVEPTYKEVFVVFRRKDEAVNKNEIFIRQYEDIPMADIELVYPNVKLGYRPIDIIWLSGSFLLAVIGFFCEVTGYSLFGGEVESTEWTFTYTTFISLSSFLFCGFQFYQSYTNFGDEYRNLMTNLLSNKGSNGRGSMLQLSERAKYQDLKESVSAYYFLLKHGKMKASKLKVLIDDYINKRQKKCETTYDVEDSLEKVLEVGIVEHDKVTDEYAAVPLKESLRKVKQFYATLCARDIKDFDWTSIHDSKPTVNQDAKTLEALAKKEENHIKHLLSLEQLKDTKKPPEETTAAVVISTSGEKTPPSFTQNNNGTHLPMQNGVLLEKHVSYKNSAAETSNHGNSSMIANISMVSELSSEKKHSHLRFLTVSDIHLSLSNVKKVIKWLDDRHLKVDFVLNSGDLANIKVYNDEKILKEAEDVALSINNLLAMIHPTVFWIPGNHDSPKLFNNEYPLGTGVNMHLRSYDLDSDLVLVGFGGSVPAYHQGKQIWEGFPYKTEDEFKSEFDKVTNLIEGLEHHKSVLLMTHNGPSESSTVIFQKSMHEKLILTGSWVLLDYLKSQVAQSRIVVNLHGHTHLGYGRQKIGHVQVVNPGCLAESRFGLMELARDCQGKWQVYKTEHLLLDTCASISS